MARAKDSDIYDTAMGYIDDPEKWVKGMLKKNTEDGGIAYCARGAIEQALRDHGWFTNAGRRKPGGMAVQTRLQSRIIKHLKELIPDFAKMGYFGRDPLRAVEQFNDRKPTDWELMFAAFTKARNEAQEEGR